MTKLAMAIAIALASTSVQAVEQCTIAADDCDRVKVGPSQETIKAWDEWREEHEAGNQHPIVIRHFPEPKVITNTEIKTVVVQEEVPTEFEVQPFIGICAQHVNTRHKISYNGVNTHGIGIGKSGSVHRNTDDTGLCATAGVDASYGMFGVYASVDTNYVLSAGLLANTKYVRFTVGLHTDSVDTHPETEKWVAGALADNDRVVDAKENGSFNRVCSNDSDIPLQIGMSTLGSRYQLFANARMDGDSMTCMTSGRSGTDWAESFTKADKQTVFQVGFRLNF
jgi:hypothetical protein